MGNKVYPLGVLCTLIILGSFISSTHPASCCLEYTRYKISCKRLIGYTIQRILGACDLDAIIFHTKHKGYKCADPSQKWTMDMVECINRKMRKAA